MANGAADLTTTLGGASDTTTARLWKGEVRIDWEPDDEAGGCLLRPALVRRLLSLTARVDVGDDEVRIRAPARTVAALSPHHAQMLEHLGQQPDLTVTLRFDTGHGRYLGGVESYVAGRGRRTAVLLRLTAVIRERAAPETSART